MPNATLYYCESAFFNNTNCPGIFEMGDRGRRNLCLTTNQVDVPAIAFNYSQANGGSGAGIACTNPASSTAGRTVKVARGLMLITLLTCLVSAAAGQPTLGTSNAQLDGREESRLSDFNFRVEEKRDVSCNFFLPLTPGNYTSSGLIKTSDVVDCRQSPSPCTVSIAGGKKATFSSEYFLEGGGSWKDPNLYQTFGTDYVESYSSNVEYTSWVPVGQCGYLVSYSAAILYEGQYSGCSDGGNRTGTAVVVRKSSPLSSLVMTNC
ncbi:DNA excision repair protein [Pseudozyma hubeiensis SY62]|uniref:DNA excision repair protein n=1 Tax=Pseudozyma hubeiensis (strain SY62) TaxID=1305764 RepID=R9NYA7_PSEHS|nr:DNA excision repair protein [Pseudozyma hubeiensis SY62]GAC93592.1 DNA excision repair protein [Pseudozyma hubeiensis SY62]